MYKNQIQRMNESREVYKSLFREQGRDTTTTSLECSAESSAKNLSTLLGNPTTTEEIVRAYEAFLPTVPPKVANELKSVREVTDYSGGGGPLTPQAFIVWIIGAVTVGLCGWLGYEVYYGDWPGGGGEPTGGNPPSGGNTGGDKIALRPTGWDDAPDSIGL